MFNNYANLPRPKKQKNTKFDEALQFFWNFAPRPQAHSTGNKSRTIIQEKKNLELLVYLQVEKDNSPTAFLNIYTLVTEIFWTPENYKSRLFV